MDLRQLRSLVTLVECEFSVSRAAERLHLVQSAVSQHLSRLEGELGVHLLRRHGKRLQGLTEAGEQVLAYAQRTLSDLRNIQDIGKEHTDQASGVLRIGTTHTQARYVLPTVIKAFRAAYPDVELQIHQGTPQQLVEMAAREAVDFSICTEALAEHPELVAIPCYRWNRCLIALPGHPLLQHRRITLKSLCEHPLITYVFGFTGRGNFSGSFAKAGLTPRVVLSAADTDVIKTYVREGLGIGIIATLAYASGEDDDLVMRDLSGLFPWEVTKIAYQKDKYLRQFQRRFVELFQAFIDRQQKQSGMLSI
ncbi:MAG: LysR substrate-binding domain-containing protein [Chromatiales bacterium]|jgi:LysR family cys regulon transcriptional activator